MVDGVDLGGLISGQCHTHDGVTMNQLNSGTSVVTSARKMVAGHRLIVLSNDHSCVNPSSMTLPLIGEILKRNWAHVCHVMMAGSRLAHTVSM